MISEIQKNSTKPRISVTEAKIETKTIATKLKEEDEVTANKTLSKLESIFENIVPIIEEDEIVEPKKEVVIPTTTPKITKFDSFK